MSLLAPSTLEELLTLKAQHGTDAQLVAGATDLGVRLRRDPHRPTLLLATDCLEAHHTSLAFGARTTHRTVERLGATPRLRGLADACRTIGSVQTRNVGTLAGNIANASPAADAVTALVSLEAGVRLLSLTSERVIPLADFASAPGQTALRPDEVIQRVEIPAADGRFGSAFQKLGRRRAMEISIVAAAAVVRLDDDGTVTSVALTLGAVGPTVMNVPGATELLRGRAMADAETPYVLDELSSTAARSAKPRSDHRASATYRREMTRQLARRVVTQAWQRAADQGE